MRGARLGLQFAFNNFAVLRAVRVVRLIFTDWFLVDHMTFGK
jgi:hypothetical protein